MNGLLISHIKLLEIEMYTKHYALFNFFDAYNCNGRPKIMWIVMAQPSAFLSRAKLYHRVFGGVTIIRNSASFILFSYSVQDEKLWKHFATIGVDAQVYAWGLLRSIFTEALSRCIYWLYPFYSLLTSCMAS